MSQLYTVNGEEVGWKGLRTSQLFVGQIALLEKSVPQPSGVFDTGWDEIQIDPPVFRAFLLAVLDHLRRFNGSWEFHAMVRGMLQVALELDEKVNGERPELEVDLRGGGTTGIDEDTAFSLALTKATSG